MFGRRKKEKIKVCHYEGIKEFMQDYPCEIELQEKVIIIRRLKPETEITLDREKIVKIESMTETAFRQKYHNNTPNINNKIPKIFLVITYNGKDNNTKYIAFWGAGTETFKITKLAFNNVKDVDSYSL